MAKNTKLKTEPADTRGWPIDNLQRRKVDTLLPYKNNPKDHSTEQVETIMALIKRFGWTMPILVDDERAEIIAGHGRLLAARRMGITDVPVIVAMGWTEDEKRAYRIADNAAPEMSPWNPELLKIELGALKTGGFDMRLTAMPEVRLVEFMTGLPGGGGAGGEDEPDDRGKLLELVNITIADPKHQVMRGDHFVLDRRHHLFCASVITDWAVWAPTLAGSALFCPYPGVFVPFCERAKENNLVMIQPDTYIAGHMLDRWSEAKGENTIVQVAAS